jgi:hypothetical protein
LKILRLQKENKLLTFKKNKTMTNWKTTSLGLLAILGAIVAIIFATIGKAVTQELIMTSITGILAGIGLIFAKDSDVK